MEFPDRNPRLLHGATLDGVSALMTEVTLRDLFAALAPMPDTQAWDYISYREGERRTADRSHVTPSRLRLAAEYRYEVADAMLAERAK